VGGVRVEKLVGRGSGITRSFDRRPKSSGTLRSLGQETAEPPAQRMPPRAEVDRLHEEIRKIGATIVRPPQEYPEYTPPGYYACYFKDLDGIKYEIVFYPGKEP
jgi:hypothetical protein